MALSSSQKIIDSFVTLHTLCFTTFFWNLSFTQKWFSSFVADWLLALKIKMVNSCLKWIDTRKMHWQKCLLNPNLQNLWGRFYDNTAGATKTSHLCPVRMALPSVQTKPKNNRIICNALYNLCCTTFFKQKLFSSVAVVYRKNIAFL